MAVLPTDNYLITLQNQDQFSQLIQILINKNVFFEVLNPKELSPEWQKAVLLENNFSTQKQDVLDALSLILSQQQPKGFVNNFVDNRIQLNLEDLAVSDKENLELTEIAFLLKDFSQTKTEIKKYESSEVPAILLSQKIIEIEKKLNTHQINAKNPSPELVLKLARLHANLEMEKKILQISGLCFKTDKDSQSIFAFIATPTNQSGILKEYLDTQKINYQKVDWSKEIVLWRSTGGFQAFSQVAKEIGTIDTKEVDPTPILAVFFMTFFAFCLGDVVYGAILTVFTGYILFFKKIKPGLKNFFNLFFYCGLATILYGLLTNSWAGDLLNSNFVKRLTGTPVTAQSSTVFNDVAKNFQLIDVLNPQADVPVNNLLIARGISMSPIVIMMMVVVFLGLLHILSAYYLKMATALKAKDYQTFWLQASWVGFLACIAFLLIFVNLKSLFLLLAGVCFIGLFVFNAAKDIFGKILGGLLSGEGLYGLVSFGADLMSYTRLMANGLAGSVIALVINLLAGLAYGEGSLIGFILAIIILIFGHSFNLIIALFSAYINPIRLSYVEFMPKFFKGEGRSLKPIDLELSYVSVNKG